MASKLLATTLAFAATALAGSKHQPLTFRNDGTFKISILEDLHYGEAESSWGALQDSLTTRTVAYLLEAEPNPDLVVINGDLLSRDAIYPNSTNYVDQILSPLLERNLTWASLHGNHDAGFNRSVEDLFAAEARHPGSRTRFMPPGLDPQQVGVTNYYLPVFGADCPTGCGCAPELLLWFFDSRGGFAYQQLDAKGARVPWPNWVDDRVVAWFEAESARITRKFGKVIPAVTFVHIPVHAFTAITEGPGLDPQRNPGINDLASTAQANGWCADGSKNSSCAHGGQDIPFMRAISNAPGMLGMFSAHIHGTSWCYKWTAESLPGYVVTPKKEGLNICYGQHTGYGGFGDWERGARQVVVSREGMAKGELNTWIRLESGEVVGKVSLNATYGQDIYPASPNRKTYCKECGDVEAPAS
ncbi:uncharacterized protein E0L32_006071 [Thyridium curvatum]|uniref:Calcineurin-like phosphoesterase domain-containing protein n=1 Tax=Thyridium curvatum TaxID=1093900 RepID=A0A507BAI8_9PEZI|nr:uncharacterized protein E0L32_006071 [Thyridium curvatum]TPX13600.1 hypothetical protein E0L32_006071 [Thyridium curvatum]